jgi:outer membrane protein TolC
VDLLNARVDLDSDSTALINAQTRFSNARRSLNVMLGRNPSQPLAVQKDVNFKPNLRKADLLKAAQQQNSTLKAADYQVKTARLQHKIAKANYFPQVNLTSSYDYSESSQDAGFLKEQQTNGVSAGLQINMPIFQGFQNQIRAENTQMRLQNRKNQLQQAELNLKRNLNNAYATYQQNLRTLRMEMRNVENARLNLTRTREAYQIGQATSTQLREAQVNFTRAQSRLTNARYDAKLAEVELYQLAGLLLEEF